VGATRGSGQLSAKRGPIPSLGAQGCRLRSTTTTVAKTARACARSNPPFRPKLSTTRVQQHRGWGCLSAQVAAPVMNRAGKRAWELVKREMHQTGTGYIKGQLREELRGALSSEGLEAVRKHREGSTGASLSARVASVGSGKKAWRWVTRERVGVARESTRSANSCAARSHGFCHSGRNAKPAEAGGMARCVVKQREGRPTKAQRALDAQGHEPR
jgi:hypothetical protein